MWFISQQESANYLNMMNVFDTNKSGSLTDREMQEVMTKTKLEKKVCAKVWNLSNPNLDAIFSKKMFYIAMHLIYKSK